MEKVVFLDVDGVLNTNGSQRSCGANAILSDLTLLLARVIHETGAAIVISSSWRHQPSDMAALMEALRQAGIADKVVGQTPALGIEMKDGEIKSWLRENRVTRFAILDDSPHAGRGELASSFFWISSIVGLQESDAEKIVRHLNGS